MYRHHFNQNILREYDIRGIYGQDLRSADAFALGRALGQILQSANQKKLAVVGRDGRHSSPDLSQELIHGLCLSGLNVMNIGLVTTPMLYFATQSLGAEVGVMVTGSHNAPHYNGFKMMVWGKPFYGQSIKRLADIAANGLHIADPGQVIDTKIEGAYLTRIIKDFKVQPHRHHHIRVGWDMANGATCLTIPQLVKKLPGQHFLLNQEIDGDFPAHPADPTIEANMQQLKDLVIEKRLDLAIGFDGDGDRIGLIDHKGRMVWGDQILAILAKAILPKCPANSPVIYDVKASRALKMTLEQLGAKPVMCPTGHSIIKSKMQEINAPLAGEMSGHIFIAQDYYGFDDATYVALRLLNYLMETQQRLADLVDALPQFVNTPEIRVEAADNEKFALIEQLSSLLTDMPQASINRMDGIKVDLPHGWWLARASNTQPCVVIRAEAQSEQDLKVICADLMQYMNRLGLNADELKLYL